MSNLKWVVACLALSFLAHGQQKNLAGNKSIKQDFDIFWGKEFSAKNLVDDVIGVVNGDTYVMKTFKGKYGIDVVNEKLTVLATIPLKMEVDKQSLRYEGAYLFNGEIIIFGSRLDRKDKRKYLYVQHFEAAANASGVTDYQRVAEINTEASKRSSKGGFDVLFSPDKSKIFIYCEVPEAKGASEKFAVFVYDKDIQKVWSREVTLPYLAKEFTPTDTRVDNDGNVIVLGQLYNGKETAKDKKKANFSTRMLVYKADEEEADEYNISLPEINLNEMTVLTKADMVTCIGFFSKGNSVGNSGAFVADINIKTKEVLDYNTLDFDSEFLLSNYSEKQVKKAKKKEEKGKEITLSGTNYVKQVFYDDAGNKFVIAENEYEQVVTSTMYGANGMATTTTTTYYFNLDISIFKINKENEIEWAKKIPKSQVTTNDGGVYNSYYVKQMDDKFVFFYNDHIDNLKVVKPGKVATFNRSKGKSVTVAVIMDLEGNMGKTRLFSVKEQDAFARPKAFGQLEDGGIFICTQKKKKQRYGIITLK